jgi:ribonuclease P protein subunit POP4
MIYNKEIIGCSVNILHSNNKDLINVKGKIVDETRNMLILDNGKMIQKNSAMFSIFYGTKKVEVDGRFLIGRSDERLKKSEGKNGQK